MKFQCSTSLFSQACQNVQRAVSTKTSIPAVEGILIKASENEIILTGYDLEIGIITSISADVEQQGSIILNARILCEILKCIPFESVKIECNKRNLAVISSGKIKYEIMGISADDFPELPAVKSGLHVVLSQKLLRSMVHQTIFSVVTNVSKIEEQKVIYTGIKFELSHNEIKLIALDGYRMAIRKEAIDFTSDDMTFIVPSKTLAEVVKLAVSDNDEDYISMSVGKRHIMFEIGNYTVISRLLEGEFVNYKEAVPVSPTTTVKVDTRSFIESVERTSLIITDKTKSLISCVFEDNNIEVSSITPLGTANDMISADVQGNRVKIGLHNRQLLDALKASDTDEVKIGLNGSVIPIIISPVQGDSFIFVISPMRLKKND